MTVAIESLCPLIQVFDTPTSLAFYRDKLGFQVVSTSGGGDNFDWGMLKLGGAWLMLNTAYEAEHRPAAPDPARIAAHGDTCLYIQCKSADAVYEQLTARGMQLDPPTTAPYGMRQLTLRDPDGYAVCFQNGA